jgi:glucokinase
LETLNDFAYPQSLKRLKLLQSQDDDISMLGAAALVSQDLKVKV